MKVAAKKKKAPKPVVDEVEEVSAPRVDDVESAEESQKEADVSDLMRALAEAELRLENINSVIDAEVEKRAAKFSEHLGGYLETIETRMLSRLLEYFFQSPVWEVQKVSKKSIGAGDFYNPYENFKRMFKQGWKYVGNFFDEQSRERYDMFVRQKDLPRWSGDVQRIFADVHTHYSNFKAAQTAEKKPVQSKPISAARPAGKPGVKLKVTTKK